MKNSKANIFKAIAGWLFIFLLFFSLSSNAQIPNPCGPTTPTFTVNLTGNPNGTWTSPFVVRSDTCCGSQAPDRCVEFVVTLDPAAVGMIFTVCNGAVPPGALYYQVNCGPPTPVGSGICVSPPYPVVITFCKPGNNQNQYCIQSVSPPSVVTLSQNCQALMWTFGYYDPSITWNSIYPGPFGYYNNYLSCQSGCDSTWVTPIQPYPPYIDFQVCGTVIAGCNQNFCDTIRVNFPPPLTTTATVTGVSCFGQNTGSASSSTTGGIPNYTYSWSTIPPQTTPNATGLYAGTYTVTVHDAAGCTSTATVVVTSPTGMTVNTPAVTNVLCFGGNTGSATLSATGGTPPYTYSWNPTGQTTATATGLTAGVYTITITDANGCIIKTLVQITQPNLLTATITSQTNVSCFGGSNGSATVSAGGGSGTYTYAWSPSGGNSATGTGLSAGNYTVLVTDANGCKATATVSVSQPATPLTSSVTATNVTCFGSNDGTATVTASGATPGYTYSWSTIPVETTANVTDLYAGVYTITVTDANGCTSTNTVSITSPSGLTVTSPVITNVNCFGNSTGAAALTAIGGSPPYTYSWNPGGQTTSTVTGLPAGVYTITITDANGCIIKTLVQITQPPGPLTSSLVSQVNISCFGGNNGSATVSASGGTPNYTYLWSNNQTSYSATGLTAGNYSVLITDAKGCTSTQTLTITQPAAPLAAASFSANILCFGANTGLASVNVTGGTGNYTYVWNPIAPNAPSLSGLAAGNYTCTTLDANGCSLTTTFSITQPPPIVTNISATQNICSGASSTLSASVSGGKPGYTYSWNPSNATSTSIVVTPTASTTYSLTVTDANGCTKIDTLHVNVYPNPVAAFNAPNACLSNTTTFNNTSSGSITWSWNFGEPASGPNNISSIQYPTHIYSTPGTFTVTLIVGNGNGCTDTVTQTVVVNPIPTVSFTSNTVCFGNTTTFNNSSFIPSGNITGWSWNFGDPNSGPNNISASQSPTHIFTSWGTFQVILTATSDSGCQNSLTLPVTVYPVPTASFVPTQACTNDSVFFTDASTYATQWFWDFGNMSGASVAQNPGYVYTSTGTFVVTLIVTSAGGCKDTVSQPVVVNPSPVPNFSPDSVCVHYPTSFMDLTVAPGGSVIHWSWNFGDGSAPDTAQNPIHIYALAGTYTVTLTVVSSNGCVSSGIKTVVVFPQPLAAFTAPTECIDLGDKIDFTDQSHTDITNWYWYFGDSSAVSFAQNPTHLYGDTGIYVVTLIVQDKHGCLDTAKRELCIREWSFYIPNAFTPNGNGKNDFFFGKGIGIKEYELWIFDRWGNLIFHCHVNELPQSVPCQWDGKVRGGPSDNIVQEDVYVWKVRLLNVLDDMHTYIGTVTVVK